MHVEPVYVCSLDFPEIILIIKERCFTSRLWQRTTNFFYLILHVKMGTQNINVVYKKSLTFQRLNALLTPDNSWKNLTVASSYGESNYIFR